MSTGLLSQLETYFGDVDEEQGRIDTDQVAALLDNVRVLPSSPEPLHRTSRAWLFAAAAAVIVLIAAIPLLFVVGGNEMPPATNPAPTVTTVTESPTTTVGAPSTVGGEIPGVGLGDVPAFQATVRYTLDDEGRPSYYEGATIEVRISYDAPESFRRDIVAVEPEELGTRFAVDSYVATDGNFPLLRGEAAQGEELGPLVWFNWKDACTEPLEAVATEQAGSVLLTVIECDSGDSHWVTVGTPWRIKVDPDTGIVFDVDAELQGGQFRIDGRRMEILGIEYSPEFAAGYFTDPSPPGPDDFPWSPIAYTARIVGESTFSLLDPHTWRQDVIVGSDLFPGPGSYAISSNGTEYTYNADTNQFQHGGETPHWAGRFKDFLIWYSCDQSGTCRHIEADPDEPGMTCSVTDGGTVAGRPTTKYDCGPISSEPRQTTLWKDNESGYVLRLLIEGDIFFEVIAIDLEPTFPPGLFDKQCPTPDCTPAATE